MCRGLIVALPSSGSRSAAGSNDTLIAARDSVTISMPRMPNGHATTNYLQPRPTSRPPKTEREPSETGGDPWTLQPPRVASSLPRRGTSRSGQRRNGRHSRLRRRKTPAMIESYRLASTKLPPPWPKSNGFCKRPTLPRGNRPRKSLWPKSCSRSFRKAAAMQRYALAYGGMATGDCGFQSGLGALQSADALAESFAVDRFELLAKTADELGARELPPTARKELVEATVPLVDAMLAAAQFMTGQRLATVELLSPARRTRTRQSSR